MKKRIGKMALHRETLRHLQGEQLSKLVGGESFEFGCESGSCPVDCGTAAGCGSAGCGSAGCGSGTCPSFNVDSGCPACG